MFGMAFLSSFSTQPFWTSSAGYGELSVRTTMSRPIDSPRASGAWIFPKKPALSFTSSMYLTLMPVFFVNWSMLGWRFPLLVDVERPVRDRERARVAGEPRRRASAKTPGQCERGAAGEAAAQQLLAGQCAVHDSTSWAGSTTNAASGLNESVTASPGRDRMCAGLRVLDVDGESAVWRSRRRTGSRRRCRRARRRVPRDVRLAVAEPHLLRADADGDRAAAPVERAVAHVDGAPAVEPDGRPSPVDRAAEEVRDAEEAGDERGPGSS